MFLAANPVRCQKHVDDRPLIPRQLNPLIQISAFCLQKLLKLQNRFVRFVKLFSQLCD
jgi:hypothetical protein